MQSPYPTSSKKNSPSTSASSNTGNSTNRSLILAIPRRIEFRFLSLSDSEVFVFKKQNTPKTAIYKRECLSANDATRKTTTDTPPSNESSKSNSIKESISTGEKRRLIDELILEDFEFHSQSTDKDTTTEEASAETTRRYDDSSPITEEPSTTRVARVHLEHTEYSSTSSAEEYRPMEINLPEFVMLNLSGLAQLDLGSTFVQVAPEMCLRNDYVLLLNAPPFGFHMGPPSNSTQSGNDRSCDKETQTSSDDSSTPKEKKFKSYGNSPRSSNLRETPSRSSKLGQNRRIFPIDEISENSENTSIRSWNSRQNRLELQETLQRVSQSVQDCHSRRPESRRSCWDREMKIFENEYNKMEQAQNKKSMIEEDQVSTSLPNEVPEQNDKIIPKEYLKLSVERSEKSSRNGVNTPFSCSSNIRDLTPKAIQSTALMWSAINEVEVIDSNPRVNIKVKQDNLDLCGCWSWLRKLFTIKSKPDSISKTYFIRWRENQESKHSLLRTNSSFF